MTLDAHAAFFYPALKRDGDRAHAILHSDQCECRDSLEVMAREVIQDLKAALAEAKAEGR